MKIVATICSKAKDSDPELIPAYERYLGEHVKNAKDIADSEGMPFYILSGKFGLIDSEDFIADYDYYLEDNAVAPLANLMKGQIELNDITEINFYAEDKDSWKPYRKAIRTAADLSGISLTLKSF